MASKRKPERADVCIIGAGASGATAAKVLTEARRPGRGPGARALADARRRFGGDELANVNRYNLWPDPLLNPRTVRTTADEEARGRAVLPGAADGRRRHGPLAGLAAALHRERLPPAHASPATCPAPTLADWPITYDELEPYYDQGRVGVRRLRPGRRQHVRGAAQPRLPVPAAAAVALRARSSTRAARSSAGTPSRPRRRPCRGPYNGRPATVVSAFAQQHGDPTGTRSSALNVFIPDAVATGRYDLRPDCYVRELTVDEPGPGARRGLPGRRRRHRRAGGRRVHPGLRRDRVGAAAAPVAVRPLPERARQRQRPGRAQRHLPRVQRRGRPFDDPIYAWAGGGYVSASTLRVLRARRAPRLRRRRPHRGRRRRHPAADQLAPARRPDLGRRGEAGRPRVLQPQHGGRPWCCTTCRSTTTGSSSTTRSTDAWGLPGRADHAQAARERPRAGPLPHRPQRGDPGGGRRDEGRTRSTSTGSPATARTSTARPGWATTRTPRCWTAWCRAHEVDNLYVVDGGPFPTGTGANPTLTIMANAWRVAEHIAAGGRREPTAAATAA